jgi:hypothetical protein
MQATVTTARHTTQLLSVPGIPDGTGLSYAITVTDNIVSNFFKHSVGIKTLLYLKLKNKYAPKTSLVSFEFLMVPVLANRARLWP